MAARARRSAAGAKVRLRGKAFPSLDKEVVLVRVGSAKRPPRSVIRSEEAEVMVRKLGKALSKPGIGKQVVFRAHAPGKAFAYSVCPEDMTKVVREAVDGTRTVGRVVGCKFRAE
jgi:hypothetical protein